MVHDFFFLGGEWFWNFNGTHRNNLKYMYFSKNKSGTSQNFHRQAELETKNTTKTSTEAFGMSQEV